jgi:hypothetical protein
MSAKTNWATNPETLDASVVSPHVITTGNQIAKALRLVNETTLKAYAAGLEDPSLGIFTDGVFDMPPPTHLLPPFDKINRNKYRTTLKGSASDVGTYRVISDHAVESEQEFGEVELELTDASVDAVSLIDKESSHLMKEGRKVGDIVLSARQYFGSSSDIKVIVCQVVLDDIELNILERNGEWGGLSVNSAAIDEV